MSPKDMVDAALGDSTGVRSSRFPASKRLKNGNRVEAARRAISQRVSNSRRAPGTEPCTRQPTGLTPDQARTRNHIVGQYSDPPLDYNNGVLGACIGRSTWDV
jgi:hypothetical protein